VVLSFDAGHSSRYGFLFKIFACNVCLTCAPCRGFSALFFCRSRCWSHSTSRWRMVLAILAKHPASKLSHLTIKVIRSIQGCIRALRALLLAASMRRLLRLVYGCQWPLYPRFLSDSPYHQRRLFRFPPLTLAAPRLCSWIDLVLLR
jgi:hypothetical protein